MSSLEFRGRTTRPSADTRPIHRQQIQAGDLALHVAEVGEGPPIVLLHGFPECWLGWKDIMQTLAAKGYRAIAPDLPGYNLSDKPEPVEAYYLEDIADVIAALFDGLGLERVTLVGHDWGGAVAWMVASRHPERVEKLIPMNMPHPVRFAEAWKTLRQRIRSAYFYFFRLRSFASRIFSAFNAFGQRAMLWVFSGRSLSEDELEEYAKAGLQPGAMRASMSYYTALLAREPDAPVKGLSPLTMPVRIIWGDRDPAFDRGLADPQEWAEDTRIDYVEGAGHFVHLERQEDVTRLLLAALAE